VLATVSPPEIAVAVIILHCYKVKKQDKLAGEEEN